MHSYVANKFDGRQSEKGRLEGHVNKTNTAIAKQTLQDDVFTRQ